MKDDRLYLIHIVECIGKEELLKDIPPSSPAAPPRDVS